MERKERKKNEFTEKLEKKKGEKREREKEKEKERKKKKREPAQERIKLSIATGLIPPSDTLPYLLKNK